MSPPNFASDLNAAIIDVLQKLASSYAKLTQDALFQSQNMADLRRYLTGNTTMFEFVEVELR